MLALQVAAGIVLAYAIIVNQKRLLAIGGWLLGALGVIIAVGSIIWAGTAAYQYVGANISDRFWHKLGTLIGVIPIFILAATGSLGMLMLGGFFFRKKPEAVASAFFKATEANGTNGADNTGCFLWVICALGMISINAAITYPVFMYTPVGSWYQLIDMYGRRNGWDDGLGILTYALLWQWVWIPLGAYFLIKRARRPTADLPPD